MSDNRALRVRTGFIFTLVLLAFLIPAVKLPWLPLVLFGILGLLAALELHHAYTRRFSRLSIVLMLLLSLYQFLPLFPLRSYAKLRAGWHFLGKLKEQPIQGNWATDYMWLLALGFAMLAFAILATTLLIVIFRVLIRGVQHLPEACLEVSILFYIAFPFSLVSLFMYAVPNGWLWLLLSIFMPSVTDVAAYYVGSRFGRTKILPKLSPKKSLEGCLGGLVITMLLTAIIFAFFFKGPSPMHSALGRNVIFGLFAGALLSLSAQLGDWLASAIKRYFGIKNFSQALPGHGGILDRFDSIIMTLPMTLFLTLLYYLF